MLLENYSYADAEPSASMSGLATPDVDMGCMILDDLQMHVANPDMDKQGGLCDTGIADHPSTKDSSPYGVIGSLTHHGSATLNWNLGISWSEIEPSLLYVLPEDLSDTLPVVAEGTRTPACGCLRSITQLLEDADIAVDASSIDTLLICLDHGIKTCTDVVACACCDMCADNAMLLASTVQRLVPVGKGVADRLLLLRRRSLDGRDGQDGQDRRDTCGWTDGEDIVDALGDDAMPITLGQYRIEPIEMRARVFRMMMHLHLEDLQRLLARIKERIASKRGAWSLLVDAESKVAEIC